MVDFLDGLGGMRFPLGLNGSTSSRTKPAEPKVQERPESVTPPSDAEKSWSELMQEKLSAQTNFSDMEKAYKDLIKNCPKEVRDTVTNDYCAYMHYSLKGLDKPDICKIKKIPYEKGDIAVFKRAASLQKEICKDFHGLDTLANLLKDLADMTSDNSQKDRLMAEARDTILKAIDEGGIKGEMNADILESLKNITGIVMVMGDFETADGKTNMYKSRDVYQKAIKVDLENSKSVVYYKEDEKKTKTYFLKLNGEFVPADQISGKGLSAGLIFAVKDKVYGFTGENVPLKEDNTADVVISTKDPVMFSIKKDGDKFSVTSGVDINHIFRRFYGWQRAENNDEMKVLRQIIIATKNSSDDLKRLIPLLDGLIGNTGDLKTARKSIAEGYYTFLLNERLKSTKDGESKKKAYEDFISGGCPREVRKSLEDFYNQSVPKK
jgi:hypothetical protein